MDVTLSPAICLLGGQTRRGNGRFSARIGVLRTVDSEGKDAACREGPASEIGALTSGLWPIAHGLERI